LKQFAGMLTRWPRAIALLLGVLTVLSLLGVIRLHLDPSNDRLFLKHTASYRLYQRFLAHFGRDETILVALHDADRSMLTPAGLTAVRQLTGELARLPQVASVLSLTSARDLTRLNLTPYGLAVPRLIDQNEPLSPERMAAIRANAQVTGILLSSDLHTAGFLVTPDDAMASSQSREAWITAVRNIAARHATHGRQVYVAGTPIERSDVTRYLERDQQRIMPLVFVVLTILAWGFYRTLRLALIPLACMLLSLAWTMGLVGFAGVALNLITSLLPPVVMVVSVSASIHLINHFRIALAAGLRGAAAVEQTLHHVGTACLLTSLTTALGFFSLLVSPVPAVQQFALFAGTGVLLSLVTAVVGVPLALLYVDSTISMHSIEEAPGVVEPFLTRLADWIAAHRSLIFAGSLAGLLTALPGLWYLREGTDIVRALRPEAPLRVSTEFIDRHLTGVNSLELMLEIPETAQLTSPAFIRRVLAFAQQMQHLPDVTTVYSPWEPLRSVPPGLLERDEQLTVLATLLPLAVPMDAWLDPQGHVLRLSLRVRAMRSDRLLALATRVRQLADQAALPIRVTGQNYLLAQMSRTLVRTQVQSFAVAVVLILGSITLALRSWHLGLLAAIPNLLPPVMIFGAMGWWGIPLSTATTMIASVALGLIVDDTIHLFYRYTWERRTGHDAITSLRSTLQHTGRAMVFTTLILTCGFWAGVLGSFKPTVHFSFLAGCTMVLALLADLLTAPASLLAWERCRQAPGGVPNAQQHL
jgi:predicted RND superfamily exporter protein